jgi:hypothetical protein
MPCGKLACEIDLREGRSQASLEDLGLTDVIQLFGIHRLKVSILYGQHIRIPSETREPSGEIGDPQPAHFGAGRKVIRDQ